MTLELADYQFHTEPFKHQLEEFLAHGLDSERGIFWEQGTGKTKLTLDTFGIMLARDDVDALFVLAPNGVHLNWITDEIPTHLPPTLVERMRLHMFQTSKAGTKWHAAAVKKLLEHRGPVVLTMSYDGIMTGPGKILAKKFLSTRRCLYVLDESSGIKTPSAKRTIRVVASGDYARKKRVLDGTPITQGPFDMYAPLQFLRRDFWEGHGFGDLTAFKHHFGRWRRYDNPNATNRHNQTYEKLIGYHRLDELKAIQQTLCSRVTKEDAGLNLPDKLFSKRYFDLTPVQQRAYEELKNEYMTLIQGVEPCAVCQGEPGGMETDESETGWSYGCPACDGTGLATKLITAELPIVRILRLQQVACGYVGDGTNEPVHLLGERNPRLELCRELVNNTHHKGIIWARFTKDIDQIMGMLKEEGKRAMRYDGSTNDRDRMEARFRFQGRRPLPGGGYEELAESEQIEWFVANQAAGGTGITLNKARTVLYYSNNFKLRDRLQSEDRAHRIGQHHPVNYIDLIATGTVDLQIVKALRSKLNVASQIVGDRIKEWL